MALAVGVAVVVDGGKGRGGHCRSRGGAVSGKGGSKGGCESGGQGSSEGTGRGVLIFD